MMEENANIENFEEVNDSEINDLWNMLFSHTTERKERLQKLEPQNQAKPRRYLKFLTM